MKSSETSNAITQRLEKMNQTWERFRVLPEARVCRWMIQEDEKRMVDTFIEASYLENNPADDLFIPFYTLCTNASTYSPELIQELKQKVDAEREAMEAEGMTLDWAPLDFHDDEKKQQPYFIDNLNNFSKEIPYGELTVAVLMPEVINKQFIKWLRAILANSIPPNIRLIVLETAETTKLDEVEKEYPGLMTTAALDLDMLDAMRQLASAGDPTDPGVKFRKAFLELSQAAASKNIAAVEKLQTFPLTIAREHAWASMEIAVHSLVASAYIGARQLNEALKKYDAAYGLAMTQMNKGDKSAATLVIQSLFNKGSVYIGLKKYSHAASMFELAAQHCQVAGDNFQLMEARRMQGFCLKECGQWQQAFEAEKEGLAASEQLDSELRHHSTFPYLAQSLLELSYRSGEKEEYILLEEKINALGGPGWQNKIQQRKSMAS